jgi:carboxymethylenebutenolidase
MIAPTQTPKFTLLALSRLESCFEYLYSQPLTHQKVSMIGFGLGGGYTFELALREQRLRGAIVFYGRAPNVRAELRHIRCPVLAFYGSKETALFKEVTKVSTHMRQAGVEFEAVVYEGAGHAFFNEDNKFSFNSIAAANSWRRTIDFLTKVNV